MKTCTCHPSRRHYGKGLCEACYRAQYRRNHYLRVKSDPVKNQARLEAQKVYNTRYKLKKKLLTTSS